MTQDGSSKCFEYHLLYIVQVPCLSNCNFIFTVNENMLYEVYDYYFKKNAPCINSLLFLIS